MTDPAFVLVGMVDDHGEAHEMRITRDAIPAAMERGWLVLDEAMHGLAVQVRTRPDATGYSGPEDDDDDGA